MVTTSPLTDVFIQAKMHRSRNGSAVRLIVDHDMEAPERLTMAEDLGRNWFANPIDKNGKLVYASTQFGVDPNSIVGYVSEDRAAYGANKVSNDTGIHIEHAGYARQTRDEWLDWYGVAMLDRSARLHAELCKRYRIPIVFRNAADLKSGKIDGITTHAECTKAWGGSHTDPGPHFPMDWFIGEIEAWTAMPSRLPVLVKGDHDGKNSLGEHDVAPNKNAGVVSQAQKMLLDRGFELPKFGRDGDFGEETETAVRAANAKAGLPVWPIITRDLWAWLDRAPDPVPVPDPPPASSGDQERIRTARLHLLAADRNLAQVTDRG